MTQKIPVVEDRNSLEGNEHKDAHLKRGGLFVVATKGVQERSNC
mgnify:CR=1 FL=1